MSFKQSLTIWVAKIEQKNEWKKLKDDNIYGGVAWPSGQRIGLPLQGLRVRIPSPTFF